MPKAERKAFKTIIRAQSEKPAGWVEESVTLSIGEVIGKLRGTIQEAELSWPQAGGFKCRVDRNADFQGPGKASLRLRFELDGLPVDQLVRLTRSEQPLRWWFICPVENIRVANLHLPPGARRFAGRKAHGLIYRCRVQPKRGMRLSPKAVRALRQPKGRK